MHARTHTHTYTHFLLTQSHCLREHSQQEEKRGGREPKSSVKTHIHTQSHGCTGRLQGERRAHMDQLNQGGKVCNRVARYTQWTVKETPKQTQCFPFLRALKNIFLALKKTQVGVTNQQTLFTFGCLHTHIHKLVQSIFTLQQNFTCFDNKLPCTSTRMCRLAPGG